MAIVPMRLKPESGANRIKSADDAYSFMMYMRLSDRNKPHWQVARQALTTPARLTRAKCWLGERFGPRLKRKDGSLNKVVHPTVHKNHATTILTQAAKKLASCQLSPGR